MRGVSGSWGRTRSSISVLPSMLGLANLVRTGEFRTRSGSGFTRTGSGQRPPAWQHRWQDQHPPLRERLQDLPDICSALLARIAQDAGVEGVPSLSEAALDRMRAYAFPGNVRELENVLHRALALSGAQHLEAADLDLPDSLAEEPGLGQPADGTGGCACVDRWRGLAVRSGRLPRRRRAPRAGECALAQCRGNRTAAGQRLGLTLRQMRYRMARLRIQLDGSD